MNSNDSSDNKASRSQDDSADLHHLLLRVQEGNGRSREQLYHECAPLALSILQSFILRPEDLNDLKQDVFLRVFRSIDRFPVGRRPFLPWFKTLVKNVARDYHRKRVRSAWIKSCWNGEIEVQAERAVAREDPLSSSEVEENTRMVLAAIRRIESRNIRMVLLADLHSPRGMASTKVLASQLACGEGTIRCWRCRGRRALHDDQALRSYLVGNSL